MTDDEVQNGDCLSSEQPCVPTHIDSTINEDARGQTESPCKCLSEVCVHSVLCERSGPHLSCIGVAYPLSCFGICYSSGSFALVLCMFRMNLRADASE